MVNFRLLRTGLLRAGPVQRPSRKRYRRRSTRPVLWGLITLLVSTGFSPGLAAPTPMPIPTLVAQATSSPSASPTELSPADLSQSSDNGLSPATNPAISFRRPLRVSNVRIPNNREFRRSAYLFTFDFPAEAVEPLAKLVFEQVEGADYPRYRAGDSYAFDAGNRASLPLSRVDDDRDRKTITVEFDPPVEPGRQVTVALHARNPRDGIYVYRLTAFPMGATEGQYAGVEQLTFYEPPRRDRFRWR
ncbi:MAG: DUF2808 domain-containing protein [Cyanobacteria bacterium J06598_3]